MPDSTLPLSPQEISLQDIRDEFITTSSYTADFEMSDFYNMDPFMGVPFEGEISFGDFHGTNARSCEIDIGAAYDDDWSSDQTVDPSGRKGFSLSYGSAFYSAESGESRNAFGSCSRTYGLLTTNQQFTALFREDTSRLSPFSAIQRINLFKRGAGNTATTAGWDYALLNVNNVHNSRWWESTSGQFTNVPLYRTQADYFFQGSNTVSGGKSAYGWSWTMRSGGTEYANSNELKWDRWLRSATNAVPGGYNTYGSGGQGNYGAIRFKGGTTPVLTYYYRSIKVAATDDGDVTTSITLYWRCTGNNIELYMKPNNTADTVTLYTDLVQGGTSSTPTIPSAGIKIAQVTNGGNDEFAAGYYSLAASGPSGFTTDFTVDTSDSTGNVAGVIPAVTSGNNIMLNNTTSWTSSSPPTGTEYITFSLVAEGTGTQAEPGVNNEQRGSRVQFTLEHDDGIWSDINLYLDLYCQSFSTGP